MNQVAITTQIS